MGRKQGSIGIQSVEVAGRVLNAIVACGGAAPLRKIALAASLAPAKVHRYLVSLVRAGLLAQEAAGGDYCVGALGLRLGLCGMRNVDVVRVALEALPRLRDRAQETATLALWTNAGPAIYALAESTRPVFMNVRVGSIMPLTNSAVGLIFAAFHASEERSRLLRIERRTANDWEHRLQRVSRTKENGYSEIKGTLVAGVHAVAAPLWNHQGNLAAAIGLVGHESHLNTAQSSRAVRILIETADDLSARLGSLVKVTSN